MCQPYALEYWMLFQIIIANHYVFITYMYQVDATMIELNNSTVAGSKDRVRFNYATNNRFTTQMLSDGEISFTWAVKSNELDIINVYLL